MKARTLVKAAFLAVVLGSLAWSGQAEAQFQARVFTVPPHNELHFATGGATWCVAVEPIAGNFNVTDINACTVTLNSAGTGSVSSVAFDCTKGALVGDVDGNGVQDISFCWPKTVLQPLFSKIHHTQTVTVTVTGNLITGPSFGGSTTITVFPRN